MKKEDLLIVDWLAAFVVKHKFPCDNHMLNKLRVRTFAQFIKLYGEEKLLECLKRNEAQGIIYHYPDGHLGDYDQFETEEEIIKFILEGNKC